MTSLAEKIEHSADLFSRLRYDPATGRFTWIYNPSLSVARNRRFAGKEAGSITRSGYRTINISGTQATELEFAHRLAFWFMLGEPLHPEIEVDHINGDRLDNRWSNLRAVDHSANGKNKGMSRANKSGFKGVHFRQSCQLKWRAQILVDGKKIMLGHFATAREAAMVYDEAAVLNHGIYAKTNEKLGLL